MQKIYLDKDFANANNNVYSTRETNLPKREQSVVGDVAVIYNYAYNDKGQLVSAFANGREVAYKYDQYDRLIEEINRPLARKYVYTYDNGGNIMNKYTYKYDASNPTSNMLIGTDTYAYTNTNWKDQLTAYNGVSIAYDNVGNPLNHKGNALIWERGRLLSSYGSSSYTYNINGMRTSKTVGGITKTFILDGDRLIAEKWSDDTAIYYVYNANGIAGFVYNGIPYVYQKNVFGDIVAIYNNAGGKVAGYRYNAYGECYIYNPELTANSNGSTIAEINPFRYRGYYYDTESGLYYLQSRYYDPAMGRFINADTIDYIDPESINGINLYAYCVNNPVMRVDPVGHFWESILDVISLGASIIEVAITPGNPLSWASLAGDIVDLIPFVTGVGETVRGINITRKVVDGGGDVISEAKKLRRTSAIMSDPKIAMGSYEILHKSGTKYIGKGGFDRAIRSAQRNFDICEDPVTAIRWKSAPSAREAFIDEYMMQSRIPGFPKSKENPVYNKIWGPGKKHML